MKRLAAFAVAVSGFATGAFGQALYTIPMALRDSVGKSGESRR